VRPTLAHRHGRLGPARLLARLRSAGIRAAALGDRLRVGFHYFNNDSDVEAILRVLREAW
jgi:selenocysteine lyase/cysteine desulfurase